MLIAFQRQRKTKKNYKKRSKRNANDVPKIKKQKQFLTPPYLHNPSQNPGPGRRPLKKRSKRNVNSIPKTKKNKKKS